MNYGGSMIQRKMAAWQLSYEICNFNRLAKASSKFWQRHKYYRLKSEKLSIGITHFPEFFKLISVEFNEANKLLVLIRMADGKRGMHCPWDQLTPTAQERLRAVLGASLATNPMPELPLAA